MTMDAYSDVPAMMTTADRLQTGLLAACAHTVVTGRATYTFYASVSWLTLETARPLVDISNASEMYPRPMYTTSPFDRDATIYLNKGTFNVMRRNVNITDVYGWRHVGVATVLEDTVNEILRTLNLPQVAVYDEGYWSPVDACAFHFFIPNGVALMIDKTFTHIVKMVVL